MRLRCGGIFNDCFISHLLMSLTVKARLQNNLHCVEWDVKLYYIIPDSERILKISQHLVKLWARVRCLVLFCDSWGIV